MPHQYFVQPDETVEVGDEVVFISRHTGNLVRGCVAECEISQPGNKKFYRVVDFWSESFDRDAGWWISHSRIYSISSLRHEGEAL
jgi:hypothetical protein